MTFPPHIATEQIEQLPLADFKGDITVIDSLGENYRRALETLGKEKVIGFDTETKPCFIAHAPKNRMALLQLSTEDHAFIFRLQQLGLPNGLCSILSNPAVIINPISGIGTLLDLTDKDSFPNGMKCTGRDEYHITFFHINLMKNILKSIVLYSIFKLFL